MTRQDKRPNIMFTVFSKCLNRFLCESTNRCFQQGGTVKTSQRSYDSSIPPRTPPADQWLLSVSPSVAPWSPGLRVAVTATAWSWEVCTGGADSWHYMGRHRSHVRMNSVRLVYFNIWLISLLSCMFSLCLSKCHTKYLKIRYPFRWWSSYNHGPNSAVCSICTWPIPINIPPIW